MHYLVVSPLKTLPSPIYGGDYYYQLGQTNHVKYGGNPLESATINGALPGYFALYSGITGGIARVFNIEAINSEFLFSYIIMIFSIILLFYLIKKLLNNNFLAILSPLMFILPASMPIIKYTDFARFLIMPLIILTSFNFVKNKSVKNSILLGLTYGATGLTHSVAFIASSLLLLSLFVYYEIIKDLRKKRFTMEGIKKKLIPYFIILILGVSIALLYWYKPIFVYHGKTSPYYTEWNNPNWASISYQIIFFWKVIKNNFFNFSSLKVSFSSIFSLIGIVGLMLDLPMYFESYI